MQQRACFVQLIVVDDAMRLYFPPLLSCPNVRKAVGPEFVRLFRKESCLELRGFELEVIRQNGEALNLAALIYRSDGVV